jgi:glycosyltransferase involved in cell wall biosynthesis
MNKLLIYARHPIIYQVPIFKELSKLSTNFDVAFGSDISLKEIYFKEINVIFKPDTPNLLDGYNYKFFKNYGSEKFPFFSRINFSIFKQLFLGKYDFILIHGYDNVTSILLLIFSKILKIKTIWRGEVTNQISFKKKIVLKFIFKFIDFPLYSCQGNKLFIENIISKKIHSSFNIKCSVDNKYFVNQRLKYGYWQNEIFTIVFSARFTSRKRPLDLLLACNDLPHIPIKIIWIGDGPELSIIKSIAKESHFINEFVGFVNQSELGKFYSRGNIAVIPSEYDPSPKVVNELLNFNVISIMTDHVGTSTDLTFDKLDIYNVGDTKMLSKRIEYYYNNFNSLKKDIINFCELKISEYTPEQNANCIYKICKKNF